MHLWATAGAVGAAWVPPWNEAADSHSHMDSLMLVGSAHLYTITHLSLATSSLDTPMSAC